MAGKSALPSKNIGSYSFPRRCVMEVSGSATARFFPLVKNVQPSPSVQEQYLKAFSISQPSCMVFFQDGDCEKSGRARCP